jgi:hypothetical protein
MTIVYFAFFLIEKIVLSNHLFLFTVAASVSLLDFSGENRRIMRDGVYFQYACSHPIA